MFDFHINQHIFGMGSAGLCTGDANVLSEYFSMERIAFYSAFLFCKYVREDVQVFWTILLSLQSPHWTTWAEVFPVKESFEHFKLFGYKENILSANFKLLLCQSGQRYGSGAHNRLNLTFNSFCICKGSSDKLGLFVLTSCMKVKLSSSRLSSQGSDSEQTSQEAMRLSRLSDLAISIILT